MRNILLEINGMRITVESASPEEILAMVPVPQKPVSIVSDDSLFKACGALCAQNNKIQAIKLVREVLGIGLKEAKDWVEARWS